MKQSRVERYHSLIPIRCRGPLHFYSGVDERSERLHVIVMAPRVPLEEARAQLHSLARVHRLVCGGPIPDVAFDASEGTTPWIAFDCDAIADFENLADSVRQKGERPLLKQASAIGKTVMETLVRCHATIDPLTGRPVCLGSLAPSNLLFSASGKLWIVGFGARPLNGACIAPEVAMGAPPTPGSDTYAVTVFLRSHAEFVRLPAMFRRVFEGRTLLGDAKMLLLLVWSNARILAAPASRRPSMHTALTRAREMWRFFGFEPDVAGFAAYVSRAIASEPERLFDVPEPHASPRIVLGPEAAWLEAPDGTRSSLGTRGALRRLILALAEAHRDHAGAAVAVDNLLQAGWPGENPLPEAGANRVYVAVCTLRKLGLGKALQRWECGYRLDPSMPCQFKNS